MNKLVIILACLAASPALAERPIRTFILTNDATEPVGPLSYHTLYLNPCKPGGCNVSHGTTNNQTDTSSIAQGHLSPWSYTDADWKAFMSCMKDVMYPYNVTVTDVDPGAAPHAEIMVAGSPGEIGLGAGIGGVSPYAQGCAPISNPLVFDFAAVWRQGTSPLIEEICATAAQEISHSYTLDHVSDASDPMTYFQFSDRRYFHDNVQCGSDCTSSSGQLCNPGASGCRSPTGLSCTTAQTHQCLCGTSSVQNDSGAWLSLFGAGSMPPPIVKVTSPLSGQAVQPGFIVKADITSDIGVTMAELRIDGMLITTAKSPPFVFNAPQTLAAGTHHIEITAYNHYNVSGKGGVDAYIGAPCMKPSDCPDTTQTCIGGRCVAGPGTQGGLGSPCTDGTQCASGTCASDGTNMYCVEQCTTGQCPASFGCLETMAGTGMGVCWPGFNDGSGGGGGCSTGQGGPLLLGLGFAGLLLRRKR